MKASLLEVIARARRRLLRNALTVGGVYTACAGTGSFVLVLLLGTEIVDWRRLAAVPVLTLAAASLLAFRRRPSAYETAQLLDVRLHLADTLSTAVFFWRRRWPATCEEETRLRQREQATQVAGGINVQTALPLRMPRRTLASLTALTLLGAGLVLLRYHSEGRLDLRRSMVPGIQLWVRSIGTELARIERHLQPPVQDKGASTLKAEDSEVAEDAGSDPADSQPLEGDEAASRAKERAQKSREATAGSGKKQEESQSQQQVAEHPTDSNDEASSRQQDAQSSGQNADQPGTRSGLLAQVSDSLANLISALKPKPANATAAQGGQAGSPGSSRQSARNGKANTNSLGEAQAPDSGSQGEAGDRPASEGGMDAMSDSPSGSDQRGGSGAGHDDGNKQIQLAKQLEAMGKLSVILGKRSQSVSGNATVEVKSGHPELKTAYEARQVSHDTVDASAERDRIPIEFEAYVQEYFRELRKTGLQRVQKK